MLGTIAGMMSKTGMIGYLGSFKVPEVVMGVNAFTLAAQAVNPKITGQAGDDRHLVRSRPRKPPPPRRSPISAAT